ncbi:Cutinase transcription factor 1 beta [Cyphellophora attinorum]|uniref:Cutinase transcription factor 1 beta n=1 Tax=Cyphellophora attinorum TaxID=1664694 RepID=A0A0N0NMW9_9EURO|nr:Cutinase transcription factor 1 beta [Phialophora attinorum]KPI40699.1 Cutinase transcription factor 1 beta [Phialophora attinorum]
MAMDDLNLNNHLADSLDSRAYWPENVSEPAVAATLLDHLNGQSHLTSGDDTPAQQPFDALPPYIKALPSHFEQDDVTYLRNKGALAVPQLLLRDELIQSYANYVHPFMPLLDLGDFMRTVRDSNARLKPISLLLFQAVMFAGIAHVPLDVLKQNGHASRRDARRAFFNKARLLYDLDYEDDPMATVQALLLMTYWREDPAGRKETHHWLDIALSLVQKLGLQHSADESSATEHSLSGLRRRIWWSAYVRDCQISLSTGYSTRISEMDFTMPMLQYIDFEADSLPGSFPSSVPGACSQSSESRQLLANMFIDLAKLALCTSYILSIQNGVAGSRGSKHTATVIANTFDSDVNDHTSEQVLTAWKESIAEQSRYLVPARQMVESGDSHVLVHRAFLHMTYNSLLFAVHRFPLQQEDFSTPARIAAASQAVIRVAATNICAIASALEDLDLLRYLPSPTITVLLPAIMSHLSDALAPASSLHHWSLKQFHRCMQFMAALRDMYAAADYSTAFLQCAIMRAPIGPERVHVSNTRERRGSMITAPVQDSVSPFPPRRSTSIQEVDSTDLMATKARRANSQTSPLSTSTPDNLQLSSLMTEYGYLMPTPVPFAGDEDLFTTLHESENQQMFSPGWFLSGSANTDLH